MIPARALLCQVFQAFRQHATAGQFHTCLLDCGIPQYMGPTPPSYTSTVVGLPGGIMICSSTVAREREVATLPFPCRGMAGALQALPHAPARRPPHPIHVIWSSLLRTCFPASMSHLRMCPSFHNSPPPRPAGWAHVTFPRTMPDLASVILPQYMHLHVSVMCSGFGRDIYPYHG